MNKFSQFISIFFFKKKLNKFIQNHFDKVGFKRLRTPIEKNCDKSGKQNLLITQQIPLPKQLKIAS